LLAYRVNEDQVKAKDKFEIDPVGRSFGAISIALMEYAEGVEP